MIGWNIIKKDLVYENKNTKKLKTFRLKKYKNKRDTKVYKKTKNDWR
jgi:hypothetical protein